MTEQHLPHTQIMQAAPNFQGGAAFPRPFGNYDILSELGQGGMGAVYLAEQRHLGKRRALKLIRPDLARQSDSIARFQREMLAAGKLEHPNIVQAVDAGQHDGVFYLAMEFAEGPDIRRVVKQQQQLRPNDAAEIVRQACLGLEEVRKQGLVHRDIKTSNMIITRQGVVKLLDLGLARSLAKITNDDLSLTAGGAVLGTADYMAPEQADDSTDVDIRADIYSLGCAFYEMLFGRTPFNLPEFGSWQKKVLAHAREPIVIPEPRRDDLPAELCEVLLRMLAKNRDQRFATPAEIAAVVAPFGNGADLTSLASSLPVPQIRASQATPAADNAHSWTPSLLTQETTAHLRAPRTDTQTQPADKRVGWMVGVTAIGLVLLAAAGVAGVIRWNTNPAKFSNEVVTPSPQPVDGSATLDTDDADSIPIPPRVEETDAPPADAGPVAKIRSFDHSDYEVRHPLLGRPPIEIRWLNTTPLSHWNYNESDQLVTISSADEGLLAVGEIHAPSYQIEFAIHQTEWSSGAGIFWGYQDAPWQGSGTTSDEQPTKHCLYQFLRFHDRDAGERNFHLQRGCVYVIPVEGDAVINSNEVFESLVVPLPVRGEMTLKLEIKNRELASVRLEDQELFDPAKQYGSNPFFQPENYHGAFGVFCEGAVATFRNGSVKRLLNR